jgi:hypothetical protein
LEGGFRRKIKGKTEKSFSIFDSIFINNDKNLKIFPSKLPSSNSQTKSKDFET